jgi:N-carbamoylputrescine amidase
MAPMIQTSFKAGLIQISFSDDRNENWKKLTQLLEQAADDGIELIVLPELHNGRYFCQHEDSEEFDRAESIPGPTTEFLSALAKKLELVIVGSLFERRAPGLYHNTAVVLDSDGTLAGYYRKMHIPDDPGYYEKFYFSPGDSGYMPVKTRLGKIGVLICWDQWFPEAARLMSLAGAEILVYPTAIGWDSTDKEAEKQRQHSSWVIIQRSHAISNGIPLLAANRHGFEPNPVNNSEGINFWGTSFICGPQGEILAQAGVDEDRLLQASIDLKHSEKVRQAWPFLRDRRIDSYAGLTHRFLDDKPAGDHLTDDISDEPNTSRGRKND